MVADTVRSTATARHGGDEGLGGSRQTALRAISLLPRRSAFATAAALGRRRYRRARPALGDRVQRLGDVLGASSEQTDHWGRRAFEHAACDELEYLLLRRMTHENLARCLEIRGLDRLQTVLGRGSGAILYSGHVRGHYPFFGALGLLGLRPNIVGMPIDEGAAPAQRQTFERRDAVLRDQFGCRFLYMAGSDFAVAARAANALRRNEIVTFEIDHTHSARNLETVFLGRPARFPVGPLLVAQAANAPLLHFWLHRPPRHTPQIAEIGEPIEITADLEASLRACLEPLEASVQAHPESWATWLFPKQHLWSET